MPFKITLKNIVYALLRPIAFVWGNVKFCKNDLVIGFWWQKNFTKAKFEVFLKVDVG